MKTFTFQGKDYNVGHSDFLIDHNQWDKDFAGGMAKEVGIPGGLTRQHWNVINFIRDSFEKTGQCPLVFEACKANGLSLHSLKELFPGGYLRGACKLAGLSYREGYVKYSLPQAAQEKRLVETEEKLYSVDVRGFLADPAEWDKQFAVFKAHEMKMQTELTELHWKILGFLRDQFEKNGEIPTIYETCEANNLDLDDLERLFPDGYHRGAVKIAGLRAR